MLEIRLRRLLLRLTKDASGITGHSICGLLQLRSTKEESGIRGLLRLRLTKDASGIRGHSIYGLLLLRLTKAASGIRGQYLPIATGEADKGCARHRRPVSVDCDHHISVTTYSLYRQN